MSKNISPDKVSREELEALLEARRRAERTRAFCAANPHPWLRSITVLPDNGHTLAHPASAKHTRARWLNRLLLFIEIAALGGLAAVIAIGVVNMETLKKDFAEVRGWGVKPKGETFTAVDSHAGSLVAHPDPDVKTKELPGSSFPPEDEDFPPALSLFKPIKVRLPPPLILPQMPTRIVIPAIGVDWPVVEGDDWDSLKLGVGHRLGTPSPGERGNMVLSGHNDVYGEVFKNLEYLGMNEEVLIYAGERKFRYVIRSRRIVDPTDTSPLNQTSQPIVTLITCWPYRVDTMRIILVGELAP